MADDQRYVYGLLCTWHGSIHDTKTTAPMSATVERSDGSKHLVESPGIPCCPHCGCGLMEYASIAEWKASASKFATATMLDFNVYYSWLEWLVRIEDGKQVKCSPMKGWDWRESFMEFRRASGL